MIEDPAVIYVRVFCLCFPQVFLENVSEPNINHSNSKCLSENLILLLPFLLELLII